MGNFRLTNKKSLSSSNSNAFASGVLKQVLRGYVNLRVGNFEFKIPATTEQ